MIVFSVSALEKAPVTLQGEEPPEFLELAEDDIFAAASPVCYDLTARLVSGGILVTGSVSTSVSGICGRCLHPAECDVAADEIELFMEAGDAEEIDISSDIRAELLLELPMNMLCSEDCQGICPDCGADLNSEKCRCGEAKKTQGDFRWSALDGLDL
jgi:uncharacterized protein